jgi:dTDP-glucose 4,6-dehydratase
MIAETRSPAHSLGADLDHILDYTDSLWQPLRGARFFLTGGTGFVGTWLTESLLWANQRLNLKLTASLATRNPAGFAARAPHLAHNPALRLAEIDLARMELPRQHADFIIHAATARNFAPNREHPASIFDRDIASTRHALELASLNPGCRFLFTSSGAVYGKQPPALERIPEYYAGAPQTTDTQAVYGQAKRVSEYLCSTYSQVYGFDAMIARLFAFVGPYLPLDENYAAGNFMGDALEGGPIRISGDGTPFRSYLYAADMAIWLWTILFRGEPCAPYNVGSPHALTIQELARTIAKSAAQASGDPTPLRIEIAQRPKPGEPPARYVPSTRRAETTLGLYPWIPLEEAVRRTYGWHARASQAAAPAVAGACA